MCQIRSGGLPIGNLSDEIGRLGHDHRAPDTAPCPNRSHAGIHGACAARRGVILDLAPSRDSEINRVCARPPSCRCPMT